MRDLFGRRRLMIVFLALLVVGQLVNRHGMRSYRASVPELELELISPGQRLTASLLGGFRSILVTILWIRSTKLLEESDYLLLPDYFATLRQLQGSSPALYRMQAATMALDIPHILYRQDAEKERRQWTRQGLDVLHEGLERYPQDSQLLATAALIYRRFHPDLYPDDRRHFLSDRGLNPHGKDPLDITAAYLEKILQDPDHPSMTCAWLSRNRQIRLSLLIDEARDGDRDALDAAEGVLRRLKALVSHFQRAHGASVEDRREVDRALDEIRAELQALKDRK